MPSQNVVARGTSYLLAGVFLLILGIGVASAQGSDSIGLSVQINNPGTATPGASETPIPTETPEPTEPSSGTDKTPTVVKGLPNTGAAGSGSSPVAVLTLASLAGFALMASAVLVRRRPSR